MAFMATLDDLERARALVTERDLERGDDERPKHVVATLDIIQEMNPLITCDMAVSALMHDSVEDNISNLYEVETLFGKVVATDVEYLTEKPRRCRKDFMSAVGYLRATPRALEIRLAARLQNWQRAIAGTDAYDTQRATFYAQEYAFFRAALQTPLYLADYWVRLEALAQRRPEATWMDPETQRINWGVVFPLDKDGNPVVG
jgi:(p)ppGpp synthase/HD superfamily hydrolase